MAWIRPISILLKIFGHGPSRRLPFAHTRSLKNYQLKIRFENKSVLYGPFITCMSHIVIKLVEKLFDLGKICQNIEENSQKR